MKKTSLHNISCLRLLFCAVLTLCSAFGFATTTHGQLLYIAFDSGNKVATYNGSTGVVINPNFITGLYKPYGLALDGAGNLYIGNLGVGGSNTMISKHDATTGQPIAMPFINSMQAIGLAVSGVNQTSKGNLYNANSGTHVVGKYDAGSATVYANPLDGWSQGVNQPYGIAAYGGYIYVVNHGNNTVGKYTTGGSTVSANFINSGLNGPWGIAIDTAGYLYVANSGDGTVKKFRADSGEAISGFTLSQSGCGPIATDGRYLYVVTYSAGSTGKVGIYEASTGATINANLIPNLTQPVGIAIAPLSSAASTSVTASGSLGKKFVLYPSGASVNLVQTAKDLQRRINKMTGATTAPTPSPSPYTSSTILPSSAIILGKGTDLNLSAKELPDVWNASTYDPKGREHYILGYAVPSEKSYIVVAGTTDAAIRAGTYDLLQQLGCRWFFPGGDSTLDNGNWTIIPTGSSLSWTTSSLLRTESLSAGTSSLTLNITTDETAEYKMRATLPTYFGFSGEWAANYYAFQDWAKTARLHGTYPDVSTPLATNTNPPQGLFINVLQNYKGIVAWSKLHQPPAGPAWAPGTQWPVWNDNYYSLVGSARLIGSQLAVSNHGVENGIHDVVKAYAKDYFYNNLLADCVTMDSDDSGAWCECAPCKLIQDPAASGGYITNRVVYLANQAANAVKTEWPNNWQHKYVGLNAYSSHQAPPEAAYTPAPNTYVLMTDGLGAPGDYTTPYVRLSQWQSVLQNLGFYEFNVFTTTANRPGAGAMATAYAGAYPALFRDFNSDVYLMEATNGWGPSGLGYYLLSKVLWKSSSDVDALKQDFFAKCFGNAVVPMTDFYNSIDGMNAVYLNKDLLGWLYKDLQTARSLETSTAVINRLDDLTLWVRYVELYMAYRATTPDSNPASPCQQAMKAMLRFAWQIRNTNMVDSNNLFYYVTDPNWTGGAPFVWPSLNANGNSPPSPYATWNPNVIMGDGTVAKEHPIKPSGTPFPTSYIVTLNTNGVTNNATLPEAPKVFSRNVVPSCRTAVSPPWKYRAESL